MSTPSGTDVLAHDLLPVADARSTTALAWRLVRARRLSLLLTIASFLLAGLAGIVPVLMIGRIVDVARDGGDAATVTGAAGRTMKRMKAIPITPPLAASARMDSSDLQRG